MTDRGYYFCDNCTGSGSVTTEAATDFARVQIIKCPVCLGRGIATSEQAGLQPHDGDPKKVRVSIMVETEVDIDWDEIADTMDGDVKPRTITAAQVLEALQESGSKRSALDDWGLDDFEISVSVKNSDGKYTDATW